MKRAVIIVSGLVQGVGFRFFVKSHAEKLGLVGFVRNKDDGSVEVVAEGPEDKLKELIESCRKGPRYGRVDKINFSLEEAANEFLEFTAL